MTWVTSTAAFTLALPKRTAREPPDTAGPLEYAHGETSAARGRLGRNPRCSFHVHVNCEAGFHRRSRTARAAKMTRRGKSHQLRGTGRAGTAKNDPRASHINKCGKSFPNKLSFTSPSPGNSYKWIDLVLTNAGPNSAGGGGGGRRAAEENTRGGERKREWGKRYEARCESDEAEWSRWSGPPSMEVLHRWRPLTEGGGSEGGGGAGRSLVPRGPAGPLLRPCCAPPCCAPPPARSVSCRAHSAMTIPIEEEGSEEREG